MNASEKKLLREALNEILVTFSALEGSSEDDDSQTYTLVATEYDHGDFESRYVCQSILVAKEIAKYLASFRGYNAEETLEWRKSGDSHVSYERLKRWKFKISPTVVYRSRKQFEQSHPPEDGDDE